MTLSAAAWIAIAAACAAAAALAVAVYLAVQIRRVRASQLVLLGGGKDDLVDFAVSLQARIDDLHGAVDEVAAALARVDPGSTARSRTPRSFATTPTRARAAT